MKNKRWILMFFVLIIFAFAQTQALAVSFYSGNDLFDQMKKYQGEGKIANVSGVDFLNVTQYIAYISGVYDATESLYNVPDGVNMEQLVAVVFKYLKKHPEKWNESAASLVIKALKEAFPLKKSK